MQTLDRIVEDPAVMNGQCCVKGCVTVSSIVNEIARGKSIGDVARSNPSLDEEDVLQALKYSARQLAQWLM